MSDPSSSESSSGASASELYPGSPTSGLATSGSAVPPVWRDVIRGFHERTEGAVRMIAVMDDGRETSAQRDTWRTWLSEEERACFGTFGSEKRRREFIAGRAAARSLLAEMLSCEPAEIVLQIAGDGAVDVPEAPVHLSIAHSGPHAVAAVAEGGVGVDVEQIVPRDPGVERFLMAPDQVGIMQHWPYDRDAALVLAWALKESVLKARRSGFRLSPKKLHLELTPAPNPERGGAAVIDVQNGSAWRVLYASAASPGERRFWCAVAIPA